jgi:hypothetical protein
MKSKVSEDRFIIECSCGSPDHLLIIDLFEDDKDDRYFSDISFYFVSNYRLSFFKRLWVAFKYVFFLEPPFESDSVHITEQNIEDLEEMTERLRSCLKIDKKSQEEILVERLLKAKTKYIGD